MQSSADEKAKQIRHRWDFPIQLPRHAFHRRLRARAGDVWRAFQEVAVTGSTLAGWPPDRYRGEGCAFVVRQMRVVHHLETFFGEELVGHTWVESFKRGTISKREVRLTRHDGTPVASGSQKWVHVDETLKPARARQDLLDAFPLHQEGPSLSWPALELEKEDNTTLRQRLQPWLVTMDPLDHANHPAFIDWCDETLGRHYLNHEVHPADIAPIADEMTFFAGVDALSDVDIELTLEAKRHPLYSFSALISVDGQRVASGRLLRRIPQKKKP